MNPNITSWSFICEFINARKNGDHITRANLIQSFHIYMNGNFLHQTSTLDGYKRLLTRIGVLEDVSRGKYKKIRNVPETLTSVQARRLATESPNWKDWFMSLEERVKRM